MYRIGEFSRLTKATIKTLRYYDEIGLLKPAYTDSENGYRYYTTEQLVVFHKILSLRQLGFSIGETANVLSGKHIQPILEKRRAELNSEIASANDMLTRVNNLISNLNEEYFMEYQAVIKELPECIVYSRRMVIPSYEAYFKVIPETGEKVAKANPGLKCASPEYSFVVYLDGEYRETNISIEYCEAVTEFGTPVDDITFKKLESVTAVCVLHKGPYSELSKAYAFIAGWIEQNGYEFAGYPRESYIDGIWNKESPEDWLTEIQIPVSAKAK